MGEKELTPLFVERRRKGVGEKGQKLEHPAEYAMTYSTSSGHNGENL